MSTISRALRALMLILVLASCGGAPAAPAPTSPPAAEPTAAPAPTSPPAAEPTAAPASALKIVASTSWVAAFAKAAGATDITVIAPSNIQHPPDYDPKPSDLAAISAADYVLFAGFEGFAARMQEAAGGDSAKLITVATENSPEAIHAEVTRLGELFGTADAAAAWLADFDAQYAQLSGEVQGAIGGQKPVVVAQAFMVPWVHFAGLEPAGTYGPMPLGPADLQKLADLKPAVVFENVHMGGGAPVVEATGASKIDLINFPGDDLDLIAVFRANAKLIEDAAAVGLEATGPVTPIAHPEARTFDVRVAQYLLDTAGFHDMAETLETTKAIDPGALPVVTRVGKVLAQTTWPADLNDQAAAFMVSLKTLETALKDGKVEEAVAASATVHDTQHELSHAIDHWGETAAVGEEVRAFDVSVAQYLLDTAGFHDMAETLEATKAIDPGALPVVTRVGKVLGQTAWPAEVRAQADAFMASLTTLETALKDGKVEEAVAASATVHDTQHELSHAIDGWVESAAVGEEARAFDVSVAQYLLDTAGFHDMAETLETTKAIDPGALPVVTRVGKVLGQTAWPAEVRAQADAFMASLATLETALKDGKVEDAVAASATVHDTQHELSHAIDALSGAGAHDH